MTPERVLATLLGWAGAELASLNMWSKCLHRHVHWTQQQCAGTGSLPWLLAVGLIDAVVHLYVAQLARQGLLNSS